MVQYMPAIRTYIIVDKSQDEYGTVYPSHKT